MKKEIKEMANDISVAWQEANRQQCISSDKTECSLCEAIAEILYTIGYKKIK